MVRDGAIGTVRHFEASYLQSWLTQPAWGHWDKESQWLWRLSTKHGSKGVLGDVGIHILDFATFIAGHGCDRDLLPPADLRQGPGRPDRRICAGRQRQRDDAAACWRTARLGTVAATRFATGHLNDLRLRIYGDKGGLEVCFEKGVSRLRACLEPDLQTATWHEVEAPVLATIYQRFIAAIRGEGAAEPDFARGAALQRLLDRAEQSAAKGGFSLKV